MRILIVDDDGGMRLILGEFLLAKGFEIILAADGLEGLMVLSSVKIDLVISDVVMPGMDGKKFLREIKKRWPEMKVIMISGTLTEQGEAEILALGAFCYMKKPFFLPDLISKIEEAFRE